MTDADSVLRAYEQAPYPPLEALRRGASSPTVPAHQVNTLVWPHEALHPRSRILVAGCGTGHEAARLALENPEAEVVAVDFSPRSIAIAEQLKGQGYPPQIQFAVADLTGDVSTLGTFDFVTCNAVADYVPDSAALLRGLRSLLAPGGVLFVGVNSADHPARRVQAALAQLDLPTPAFSEDPARRAALRLARAVRGDDPTFPDFAAASEAWLQVEMFPAFAHHRALADWLPLTRQAGLHFRGTLNTPFALTAISDADLPMLYSLDRGGVSTLVEGLRANHMLPMLFTADPPAEPPWSDVGALQQYRPRTHPCVAPHTLPPLGPDWMAQRFLALQSPGVPELRLPLSAYMLELYRLADGTHTLAELRAAIPHAAPDDHVRSALFRGYHAGVLYMAT